MVKFYRLKIILLIFFGIVGNSFALSSIDYKNLEIAMEKANSYYYKDTDYKKAIQWYTEALRICPSSCSYNTHIEAIQGLDTIKKEIGFSKFSNYKAQIDADNLNENSSSQLSASNKKFYKTGTNIIIVNMYNKAIKYYERGVINGKYPNRSKGFKLIQKAANYNFYEAQHKLGDIYSMNGNHGGLIDIDTGLPIEYSEGNAFKWYKKAAKQGYAPSQYEVGAMLQYGEGAPKNYPEAIKWYTKAALQDQPDAQYELGQMYTNGLGVPMNYKEAEKWYALAVKHGDMRAKNQIKLLNGIATNQDKWKSNPSRVYSLSECKKYYPESTVDNNRECISESEYYNGNGKVYGDFFYPDGYLNFASNEKKAITQDGILNELKASYINKIASKVKDQWRYKGAKDNWGCDVLILQDSNGKVQSVNLQSCVVDDSAKVRSFKNSIERAVYKASPLPNTADKSVFDRELLIHFSVNDNVKNNSKASSLFSSLWKEYGGNALKVNKTDSNSQAITKKSLNVDSKSPEIYLDQNDFFTTISSQVLISGLVKDDSAISGLSIYGKSVPVEKSGEFKVTLYVPLGKNNLTLKVLDIFGNNSSRTITIVRNKVTNKIKDKRLVPPAIVRNLNPNAVALIIGVDNYESIASAPWAETDASVFYDYAQNALGISNERIRLITGSESSEVGIWKSIERWLPTEVKKHKSDVYVYFAGHGLASADGNNAYLIPWDGEPDLLERTAILRSELIEGLKDLDAKNVTLFMDTCYSGKTKGGKGTLVANSRGLRIVKKDKLYNLPDNFTLFSAAGNDETASSHPSLKHGLFSYWMMRGLGGDADSNSDRKITNGELHEFINKNVKKAAVSMGRKQNSQLLGDEDRVIASW